MENDYTSESFRKHENTETLAELDGRRKLITRGSDRNTSRLLTALFVDERKQNHSDHEERADRKNRRALASGRSRYDAEDDRAQKGQGFARDAEKAEEFRGVLFRREERKQAPRHRLTRADA